MKPLSRIALVMGIMMVVLGIVLAKIQPGSGVEDVGIVLIVLGAVFAVTGGAGYVFLWLKVWGGSGGRTGKS